MKIICILLLSLFFALPGSAKEKDFAGTVRALFFDAPVEKGSSTVIKYLDKKKELSKTTEKRMATMGTNLASIKVFNYRFVTHPMVPFPFESGFIVVDTNISIYAAEQKNFKNPVVDPIIIQFTFTDETTFLMAYNKLIDIFKPVSSGNNVPSLYDERKSAVFTTTQNSKIKNISISRTRQIANGKKTFTLMVLLRKTGP